MRVEALLLIGVAVFFAIVGAVYWVWGLHNGAGFGPEQGGTMMLIGTTLLGLLPGGYYFWWSRRMKPRPEDRADASIEEGAGVIGSFPDSSVWPFVLGMGLFLVVLSVVFGLWLIAPGLALVLSAAIGVTVESRRGGTV
ncbi:MAG TPA: cytochrome c oxidase subunit 4 [Acidimicrobiales bacterium]|nr:cytochrome c oxidase subunit 4 [Acidimicrobiales bacterium]